MMASKFHLAHNTDARRNEIVHRAVDAANRILIDESDGSVEEANYLVARVAKEFNQQTFNIFELAILESDLESR